MFIAIATEDFPNFTDNNEAEDWTDYTNQTEYPIFTGTPTTPGTISPSTRFARLPRRLSSRVLSGS